MSRINLVLGSTKCEKCESLVDYNEENDAFYCSQCNEWLEGQCNDPTCEFCNKRSEKPIENYKY